MNKQTELLKEDFKHQFIQVLCVTHPYDKLMRILSNAKNPLNMVELTDGLFHINVSEDCPPVAVKNICKSTGVMLNLLVEHGVVKRQIHTAKSGDYKGVPIAYYVIEGKEMLFDEMRGDK